MEKYKDICPHTKCTGCMACINSCVHDAITVTEDTLGFKYPKINVSKCIECGLCHQTCPVNKSTSKVFPKECYAFAYNSIDKLETVASGGVGTAMAEYVLNQGGVVYGCSGEDITHVKHVRIDSKDDLYKLKGSKYVQSDTIGIYKNLLRDIISGKVVLFIGTPCQVAGIRNFLRKPYPNLTTIDLVCHGVPSQRLLNENIEYYKDIDKTTIRFRTKKNIHTQFSKIQYGWCFSTIHSPQKFKVVKWFKDPYMKGFLECATFRESCYTCDYAYCIRNSDITISDFWGLNESSGLKIGTGVSATLINTENGEKFWNSFYPTQQESIIVKRTPQEAISGNGQLQYPSRQTLAVTHFRKLYPKYGIQKALSITLKKRMIKVRMILFVKRILDYIS